MNAKNNTKFWSKGLYFSCTQCSACCRFDPGFVFLSEEDLACLVEWSGLKKEEFIQVYCRWVVLADNFEYLCLKEKSNYDCILWKEGCTAYKARPLQCSAFPFWDSVLKDKASWEFSAKGCPGIAKGKLHSADEIEKVLKEQEKHPYIRREFSFYDGEK